jgi:hypothetical protein
MKLTLFAINGEPGELQRARLYSPGGAIVGNGAMNESPAGIFSCDVELGDLPDNLNDPYQVEVRVVTVQTDAGFNASTVARVPRQPYKYALSGVWYDSAGEVAIISLLNSLLSAASSSLPSLGAIAVFDPMIVETGADWEQSFIANGQDISGWEQITLTVKRNADESDGESLLAIRITNPTSALTDGLRIHNGNVIPVGDDMQGGAQIAVGSVSPNATFSISASAVIMDLPPSPENLPFEYEWHWWNGAGVKRSLGRGEITFVRSVYRSITAP